MVVKKIQSLVNIVATSTTAQMLARSKILMIIKKIALIANSSNFKNTSTTTKFIIWIFSQINLLNEELNQKISIEVFLLGTLKILDEVKKN